LASAGGEEKEGEGDQQVGQPNGVGQRPGEEGQPGAGRRWRLDIALVGADLAVSTR
jgi:hypothetical protein